jgi:hypothetical protein
VGEKGKLIFLLPRPAAIYIDLALRAMFPSLHVSTGRTPVYRIHSIEIDGYARRFVLYQLNKFDISLLEYNPGFSAKADSRSLLIVLLICKTS